MRGMNAQALMDAVSLWQVESWSLFHFFFFFFSLSWSECWGKHYRELLKNSFWFSSSGLWTGPHLSWWHDAQSNENQTRGCGHVGYIMESIGKSNGKLFSSLSFCRVQTFWCLPPSMCLWAFFSGHATECRNKCHWSLNTWGILLK